VFKVRVENQLTTLRLWPLMTLLSRTADELYRLDCDGVLSADSDSTSRVSSSLCTALDMNWRMKLTNAYEEENVLYVHNTPR